MQSALMNGQKAEDRPDISFRVLRINIRAMMEHILCDFPFDIAIARI